jgi:hypothetical protein
MADEGYLEKSIHKMVPSWEKHLYEGWEKPDEEGFVNVPTEIEDKEGKDWDFTGSTLDFGEPSFQMSDLGDIGWNILKGTPIAAADLTAYPFEWFLGDITGKLGIPTYEDIKTQYRPEFETGDYGWMTHADKLRHATGLVGPLGIFSALGKTKKGMEIAKRMFPTFKYWSDLMKLNRETRSISGSTEVGPALSRLGRWAKKTKEFGKDFGITTLQSMYRPLAHIWKTRGKVFKGDDIAVETPKGWKPIGPSAAESELFKNLAQKYGALSTIGGAVQARKLFSPAKAEEIDIDVPRAPSNRAMIEMANRRGSSQSGWGMSVEFPETGQKTARYKLPD